MRLPLFKEVVMRKKLIIAGFLVLLIFGTGLFPASAGEMFGGMVTEVRSAEIIVVDYGGGQYVVRIVGIVVPAQIAVQAKQFSSDMVLGKEVRGRFEGRNQSGEMVSRLFVGDPGKEVGIELLRAGLARRQSNYDYKYGELAKAEAEARKARRGLWVRSK
jgi:endonuclease YncB( thermonuclease family)